jgi:hypothetical protein
MYLLFQIKEVQAEAQVCLETMRTAYQRQLQALHAQVISLDNACKNPNNLPLSPGQGSSLQMPVPLSSTPGHTSRSMLAPPVTSHAMTNVGSFSPVPLLSHHPTWSCKTDLHLPHNSINSPESLPFATADVLVAGPRPPCTKTPHCKSEDRRAASSIITAEPYALDGKFGTCQEHVVRGDALGGTPTGGSPAVVTVPTTINQQRPFSGHLGSHCSALGGQPMSATTLWETARPVCTFLTLLPDFSVIETCPHTDAFAACLYHVCLLFLASQLERLILHLLCGL